MYKYMMENAKYQLAIKEIKIVMQIIYIFVFIIQYMYIKSLKFFKNYIIKPRIPYICVQIQTQCNVIKATQQQKRERIWKKRPKYELNNKKLYKYIYSFCN